MTDSMSRKRKIMSMRPLMEQRRKPAAVATHDKLPELGGLAVQLGGGRLTSRSDSTSPIASTLPGARRWPSLELRHLADLKPAQRNARTHSPAQVRQIARSIKRFGFVNPIIIDAANRIVAGHGRALAAKDLRLREVPVIRLEGLTPEEVRAYALADNRIAELAGWDKEILALELQELCDIGFDLEVTGFEVAEIDGLILDLDHAGGQKETDEAADACPNLDRDARAVARAGDLWRLGNHVIAVGDGRDPAVLARLMEGMQAQAVITDPPYNIPISGFASGKGRVKHRDFAMASGEMSAEAFKAFLGSSLSAMIRHLEEASYLVLFMDWRHIALLIRAGEQEGLQLRNICVWVKPRGGMGSLYRSQHELVAIFSTAGASPRNNIQLGRFGRNRTNVWHYAGPNALSADGRAELESHPTVKPAAMIADAMLDLTARGGIVLDPFAGSGTIFIAAEKTGRHARGVEIDPHYADTCIRRWQDYTGACARLVGCGQTFDQVTHQRLVERDGHRDASLRMKRPGARKGSRA